MRLLDHSMTTPEQNLALDEALFELCEDGGPPCLRFWEPDRAFVVLGYTNRAAAEVNLQECRARSIPVLRRMTGGGTVLQAPGVLNYNLVLPLPPSGPLSTISGTNRYVLERMARALAPLLPTPLTVRGDTDLALEGRKVSGNAQRRGRRAIVFHGTFLLGLDLTLLEQLLPMPSREPDYRTGRSHEDFLQNLTLDAAAVKRALQTEWQAVEREHTIPQEHVKRLLTLRYANPQWNHRR
jgi:lipoate-protein ligase A